MDKKETLKVEQLNTWLDELQSIMPGDVTVIYDACRSGSFSPILATPTYDRLVITSATAELYGGIRKTFGNPNGRWHPYIGGGLSLIRAGAEIGGFSENDSSPALYAHGGILLDISKSMYLGLDLRGLFGSEIDLPSFGTTDADYTQLALVLGWSF